MRHRPIYPPTLRNGCAPVAIAAFTGDDPMKYTRYGTLIKRGRTAGRFSGMTDFELFWAIKSEHPRLEPSVLNCPMPRTKLAAGLPFDKHGIVLVKRGRHYHALAFDGKMVYDTWSGGRWMWSYDSFWAKATIRKFFFFPELT